MGPSFDTENPPPNIAFGIKYESPARDQFLKSHKFIHKGCSISTTGLYLNYEYPFLGASPDGILYCKQCPHHETLIEIKCLSSNRNYKPGAGLVVQGICKRNEDGTLVMNQKHQYFYQVQTQMLLTNIKNGIISSIYSQRY